MAFLLKVRSLLLAGLLSVLLLVAMQEAAQAEPVLASYHGGELAGNPTASGEPFNPYGLTAAHPYLPLGTLLTITNNGQSVTVRVNDRGPYEPGRGLDLSLGAAQAIELTNSSPAVVEVEAAKPNRISSSARSTSSASGPETRADVPHGITSSPKAPLATRLEGGGEKEAQPLYARPAVLRRRSDEPGEDVT
jgi:rare lipoprotein A